MEPKQSIRLFLDWDGTIALTDTLSIIASIGYAKNAHRKLPPWSHFADSYMADYATHVASYSPQKSDRRSIDQELAWLESLVDVERASIERVEAAGIFADVTAVDVQVAAVQAAEKKDMRLRPGLMELLEALTQTKGSAGVVVSVNWSGTFITESLKAAGAMEGWYWSFEGIWANEIDFGTGGKLTRMFREESRGIWTAKDKSRMFMEITGMNDRGINVYVGDSSTDLDCLLYADVGICVRDEPMGSEQNSLAEALERLAISCKWIGEYHSAAEPEKDYPVKTGKTLWWVRDFKDVAASSLFDR